ncbi:MAG: HEPN domain-containing protein [Phycisphaerae bacterium]
MPPKLELVQEWLRSARMDLESAWHLVRHDPPLLETACFHAQQSIEKALKAVLLMNEQRPPRIHDLSDLFGLCERWMPDLSELGSRCEWLTTCAVELRYPDNPPPITPQLSEDALTSAEAVLESILRNMPPEVHP